MANEQMASQVLDYWFAIEFLGQASYDSCTEESKLTRELAKFMNVCFCRKTSQGYQDTRCARDVSN